jgi:hypothetical protein
MHWEEKQTMDMISTAALIAIVVAVSIAGFYVMKPEK